MDEKNEATKLPVQRVAVIGAGVSGLCCARRFTEPGFRDRFQVVVYEQTDRVGGQWVYTTQVGVDDETGLPLHSSMYKNLRTNLPKECMEFPGFKYGSHLNDQSYISWSEVLKYLDDFTDHFNLKNVINFHHLVIAVTRRHEKWKVRVKDLKIDASFEEEFDAVVVCSGHNSVPNMPSYEGSSVFRGVQIHSHDYRIPEPFRDQNVMLVGFGPSGVDIAIDIEKVAKKVFLSHHVKVAFGHQIGDAVIQKPDVKRLLEDSVVFDDDSVEKVNSIIYCTGYKFHFDFLTPSCELHAAHGLVGPLFKMMTNIYHPTMSFICMPGTTIIFPLVELQVQVYIRILLGEIILPDTITMLREYDEEMEAKAKRGLKKKHYHILGEGMERYINELSGLTHGTVAIPRAVLDIYKHSGAERKKFNFKKYRNFVYTILDDERFEVYEREESQL